MIITRRTLTAVFAAGWAYLIHRSFGCWPGEWWAQLPTALLLWALGQHFSLRLTRMLYPPVPVTPPVEPDGPKPNVGRYIRLPDLGWAGKSGDGALHPTGWKDRHRSEITGNDRQRPVSGGVDPDLGFTPR